MKTTVAVAHIIVKSPKKLDLPLHQFDKKIKMSQKQRSTISFQLKKEMIEMYSKMAKPSITNVTDHFKVSRSA